MFVLSALTLVSISSLSFAHLMPDAERIQARTTGSAASPSCTYAVRNPPPATYYCGSHGTISKPNLLGAAAVIPGSSVMPLDDCRDSCLSSKPCISFAFNYENNECTQYGSSLQKQGFSAGRKPFNIIYYNRHCFAKSCSTASTVTVTNTDTVTNTETKTQTQTETDTQTKTQTNTDTKTETNTETKTQTQTQTSTVTTTTTVTACAATPPIVNGGFEAGSISPWQFDGKDDTSVSVPNDASLAHSGSNFVSVDSDIFSFGPFSLSQKFDVCPGTKYTLSFWAYGTRKMAGASLCNIRACIDSTCTNFDPPGGFENGGNTYSKFSFDFTAGNSATSATLTFNSDGNLSTTYCLRQNIRFDDVVLAPAASN